MVHRGHIAPQSAEWYEGMALAVESYLFPRPTSDVLGSLTLGHSFLVHFSRQGRRGQGCHTISGAGPMRGSISQ